LNITSAHLLIRTITLFHEITNKKNLSKIAQPNKYAYQHNNGGSEVLIKNQNTLPHIAEIVPEHFTSKRLKQYTAKLSVIDGGRK
jgi:hypothetical protein